MFIVSFLFALLIFILFVTLQKEMWTCEFSKNQKRRNLEELIVFEDESCAPNKNIPINSKVIQFYYLIIYIPEVLAYCHERKEIADTPYIIFYASVHSIKCISIEKN